MDTAVGIGSLFVGLFWRLRPVPGWVRRGAPSTVPATGTMLTGGQPVQRPASSSLGLSYMAGCAALFGEPTWPERLCPTMQKLLAYSFRTRDWPPWSRYVAATLVVMGMLLLRQSFAAYVPDFPYLLFFPAIVVNAMLFDRGSGIYSVVLSAAFARYFLIEPTGSFAVADTRTNVGLLLFLGIGLVTSFIIEALHTTAHRLIDANRRLAAAEQEKELLLQEAGHRIKNDLATLVALVRLQGRAAKDPFVQDILATTANRIHVLSRVHERLRPGAGATSVIDVAAFMTDLCEDIKTSLIGIRPIAVRTKAEPHWLPEERSVPLGIIVNELVTNCLKYAFPDDRSGTIIIQFVRQDDTYELTVTDDGVGIAPATKRHTSSGLGHRLVRSMAAQLGGTVKIVSEESRAGTRATVRFPATSS